MPDEIDELLHCAQPWREVDLDTPEIDQALGMVRDSVKTEPRHPVATPARPRRRTRLRVRLAAAVAAVLAVPAVVVATRRLPT